MSDNEEPYEPVVERGAPFVCHCRCHLPLGFRLMPGQLPPPGMRACVYCASKHP